MLIRPKRRNIAVILALASAVLPIAGLHKFYLRQPGWGLLYLLLSWTMVPKVASIVEGIWYLSQNRQEFDLNFNVVNGVAILNQQEAPVDPVQVGAIAEALRQLETLRQDGLVSEYEFEQKRRQLLDRIG